MMSSDKMTDDYLENSKVYTVCYRFKEMLKIKSYSLLSLLMRVRYKKHYEASFGT